MTAPRSRRAAAPGRGRWRDLLPRDRRRGRAHVGGRRAARARTTSSRSTSATAGAASRPCSTWAPTAAWTSAWPPSGGRDDEPDRVVRGFPGRIGDDVPMLLAGEPWAPEELTAWLVRWVVDRVAEREGGLARGGRRDPPGLVGRRPHRAAGRRAGRAGPRRHLPDHGARRRVAAPTSRARTVRHRSRRRRRVARHSRCGPAARGPTVAARVAAPRGVPRSGDTGSTDGRERRGRRRAAGVGRGACAAQPPLRGLAGRRVRAHAAVDHAEGDQADAAIAPTGIRSTVPVRTAPAGPRRRQAGGRPDRRARRVHRNPRRHEHRGPALGVHATVRAARPPARPRLWSREAGEQLALPTQRSGSGRWAAVPDLDEADELEADLAPTPARLAARSPTALVTIGGAAAAVAVIATLFLWPAPRTTNSAISRPAPLVPALTSPAEPTSDLTLTPTATPTPTPRPRTPPGPDDRPRPGRRDDAGPERDHRADRADCDDVGAAALGVDRPADDHGRARRRLTRMVDRADRAAGRRPRGQPPEHSAHAKGPRSGFRNGALSGVAPTGFEPALPP